MALVKFGAVVAELRGSLNGDVFSRNRWGAYVRSQPLYADNPSHKQLDQRALVEKISQAWRTLSDEQRATWAGFALQHPTTNVFGDQTYLSGFAIFMQRNLVIQQTGNSGISLPPPHQLLATITTWQADPSQGSDTMYAQCIPNEISAWNVAIVEATPQISPGRSQPKNKYKRIAQINEGGDPNGDYQPAWSAIYGNVTPGLRVFLRVRLVHYLSGATTVPLHFSMLTL
jgi:hypothetical protein